MPRNIDDIADQISTIRHRIQRYGGSEADAGATIAAALLYSGKRFSIKHDLEAYLGYKSNLQSTHGGLAEAGANIATAVLWNYGFDFERHMGEFLGLRNRLQHGNTPESNASSNVAAAMAYVSSKGKRLDYAQTPLISESIQKAITQGAMSFPAAAVFLAMLH